MLVMIKSDTHSFRMTLDTICMTDSYFKMSHFAYKR